MEDNRVAPAYSPSNWNSTAFVKTHEFRQNNVPFLPLSE
jgi:hypothetical protein